MIVKDQKIHPKLGFFLAFAEDLMQWRRNKVSIKLEIACHLRVVEQSERNGKFFFHKN